MMGNSADEPQLRHPVRGSGLHQRTKTPDHLRASLRHGHGISLMYVNPAIEGHNASLIATDAPESTHGLFSSICFYQVVSTKEEENFRKNIRSFVYRVVCNGPFLFAIASYIAVTAIILNVPALRGSTFMEWLSNSDSGMAFFSAFVGFILVFRTQICYNRW